MVLINHNTAKNHPISKCKDQAIKSKIEDFHSINSSTPSISPLIRSLQQTPQTHIVPKKPLKPSNHKRNRHNKSRNSVSIATIAAASVSLKSLAGEAADPPLLQHRRAHLLVEPDRTDVPIKHHPLDPPVAHLHGLLRHGAQQDPPEALPPIALPHEQVLHVEPRLREERRVVREEQNEPRHRAIAAAGRSELLPLRIVDGEIEVEHVELRGVEGGAGGVGEG